MILVCLDEHLQVVYDYLLLVTHQQRNVTNIAAFLFVFVVLITLTKFSLQIKLKDV